MICAHADNVLFVDPLTTPPPKATANENLLSLCVGVCVCVCVCVFVFRNWTKSHS